MPSTPIPGQEKEPSARGRESKRESERGEGAGRSADKSAVGAVSRGEGAARGPGGGPPPRKGAKRGGKRSGAATERARCVLPLERTGTQPCLCALALSAVLPVDPGYLYLGSSSVGDGEWQFDYRFASHAPSPSSLGCAGSSLLWGPSLSWCRLRPSCALLFLSLPF